MRSFAGDLPTSICKFLLQVNIGEFGSPQSVKTSIDYPATSNTKPRSDVTRRDLARMHR